MNLNPHQLRIWLPRLLALGFAGFLAIFALDVFDNDAPFGQILLALLMHLIPNFLVLASLAVAWRWPRLGAPLFALLAAVHFLSASPRMHWSAFAVIDGPLILLALLFLTSPRPLSVQTKI
jgi:hypothetical protein